MSSQASDLFSSEAYAPAKDLIFKDSTKKLVQVPPNTDSFLYLGAEYVSIVHSLKKGTVNISRETHINIQTIRQTHVIKCSHWLMVMFLLHCPEQTTGTSNAIKWCAVGHAETKKCDQWSINSVAEDGTSSIECESAPTVEECLKKIMVKQLWLKIWELLLIFD